MTALNKDVVVRHFKSLQEKYSESSDEYQLIGFFVSTIQDNIHPSSVFHDSAIQKFREITGVDLHSLDIEGVQHSKTPVVESQPEETPQNPSPKNLACKHYSCSQNMSDNYKYANPTAFPTCSKPIAGMPLQCSFFAKQKNCPFYEPDIKVYATFKVGEETYTVNRYRKTNDLVCFNILDSSENILNEITVPSDEYSSKTKEESISELRLIVEEIHANTSTINLPSVDLELEVQQKPNNSYILSLVSTN